MKRAAQTFLRDDRGTALVEFAIVLPMMILVIAVIVEGARLLLGYHAAIMGVRDATRYLSRVLPDTICKTGGTANSYTSTVTTIVAKNVAGRSVLPSSVTVTGVVPAVTCPVGTYRGGQVGVATVTASITVAYPFGGVFGFAGSTVPGVTTTVSDSARIIGS